MKPITRLPLVSLRVRESGAPFAGVRWVKLPGEHRFVLGEKVRLVISYSPYVSDANLDVMFDSLINAGIPHQYLRMTNTETIWESAMIPEGVGKTVNEVEAGTAETFMEPLWINYATCEAYGAEPVVEWTKWLLIGGGLAIGGVAIGYALKK